MNQNSAEIEEATIEVLKEELNFYHNMREFLCFLDNPYKVTVIEALDDLISTKLRLEDLLLNRIRR